MNTVEKLDQEMVARMNRDIAAYKRPLKKRLRLRLRFWVHDFLESITPRHIRGEFLKRRYREVFLQNMARRIDNPRYGAWVL
jgi:hypothetical protein